MRQRMRICEAKFEGQSTDHSKHSRFTDDYRTQLLANRDQEQLATFEELEQSYVAFDKPSP